MVKVISLSNDAYEKLKAIKGNMSFSEVVMQRIIEKRKKKNLMDFFGVWADRADEWEGIKKKIYKDRKKFKLRTYKL